MSDSKKAFETVRWCADRAHGHLQNDTHLAIDNIEAELERVRARLKWFEDREPLVVNVYNSACDVCVGDDVVGQLSTNCQALLRFETVRRKPHDPDELDKHLAGES